MDTITGQILLHSLARDCTSLVKEYGSESDIGIRFLEDLSQQIEDILEEASCLAQGVAPVTKGASTPGRTLYSLFGNLCGYKAPGKQKTALPLRPLSPGQECFPGKAGIDAKELCRCFIKEANSIKSADLFSYCETLLAVMMKYLSCIPYDNSTECDVSLFDKARTSAGLAIALYRSKSEGQEAAPFLLVGGDFSGIQGYIYEITSKYASKSLKGRSFYLRLLSDAIVSYILRALDLCSANIIYNSGGCFYLVVPNTSDTKKKLDDIALMIERRLFKLHGTALYLAMDYVDLPYDALIHGKGMNLSSVWGELFRKRDSRKSSKYSHLILEDYDSFFNPHGGTSGAENHDSSTGEEIPFFEKPVRMEDLVLRPVNAKQIELGKQLKSTRYIVITEGATVPQWEQNSSVVSISPLDLGAYYYLIPDDATLKSAAGTFSGTQIRTTIATLNDPDFLSSIPGTIISKMDFYGGNENFRRRPATFEELCAKEDSQLSRLGVLRMDVDNLGKLFQTGLDPRKETLARYSSLSRSLDFFFSCHINAIWEETDPGHSIIIYSGGDDLFLVGDWEAMIQISERIHKDFQAYTCGNPNLSISGGIAIVTPKFPIMKGAEESAKEEEKAKGHICGKAPKNSISFLGTALNWENEFPAVKKQKDRIVLLSSGQGAVLPKSFISKVLEHCSRFDFDELMDITPAQRKKNRVREYWLLTYSMSRLKTRNKENDEIGKLIDCCINEVCNPSVRTLGGEPVVSNYHSLQLWALACRWAELEIR